MHIEIYQIIAGIFLLALTAKYAYEYGKENGYIEGYSDGRSEGVQTATDAANELLDKIHRNKKRRKA